MDGPFRTVHRLLSWCSAFKKYSHTTLWCFLSYSSFTRLNLLDNLSQSMQWTDCPILTASVLLLYPPLGPSLDTSTFPSFNSANSLHILPSLGSQVSQPSPALCISMSVCICLCLYVSQPPCTLSVWYSEISYLAPCLFLPDSSRFLPFLGCCMPSLYLPYVCNYT